MNEHDPAPGERGQRRPTGRPPSVATAGAQIPAIILAGGRAKPEMEAATGQSKRALVQVNGKTLLDHAVDALAGSGLCDPITVVGDMPESSRYTLVFDTGDFVGNVFAGVETALGSEYAVISTSDLPFLTPAAVGDFVRRATDLAAKTGATLVYPVVPVESCYRRFPGVKRTSLRLREGEFTGGNLMLVRPAKMRELRERIAGAYEARKSPLRLAMMLGLGTVGRVALAKPAGHLLLNLPLLERGVSRVIGGPAGAVVCDFPEIATDLDRASDFAAVGLATGDNR